MSLLDTLEKLDFLEKQTPKTPKRAPPSGSDAPTSTEQIREFLGKQTPTTPKRGTDEASPPELAEVLAAFPGAMVDIRPPTPVPDEPRLGDWVWSRPLPPRRGRWR